MDNGRRDSCSLPPQRRRPWVLPVVGAVTPFGAPRHLWLSFKGRLWTIFQFYGLLILCDFCPFEDACSIKVIRKAMNIEINGVAN